jgi:hypothetical protein
VIVTQDFYCCKPEHQVLSRLFSAAAQNLAWTAADIIEQGGKHN